MIKRFRAHPIPPKILVIVFVLVILGAAAWIYSSTKDNTPDVQDFDACVAAGNPVRETFPEQCSHKGKIFFKPGQEPPQPY